MDIKQTSRDRMELRLFVKDTMSDLIEMVRQTRPDAPALDQSRMTQRINDWLDHASTLIEKAWKLGELIGEEVVAQHTRSYWDEVR